MSIAQDKKKHFVAGFAITAVISLFFGYIIGAAAAIIAGIGKGLYDKGTGKGTPELADFAATALGAATAVATSVAVSWVFGAIVGT